MGNDPTSAVKATVFTIIMLSAATRLFELIQAEVFRNGEDKSTN
jgi:hypothetical protein